MNNENLQSIDFNYETGNVEKKEQFFDLSLKTIITGKDALGREFNEKSRLITISHKKTSFFLKTEIIIGSPLILSLIIPKTFILEQPLNLFLSGKVQIINRNENKNQLITLILDKKYKLFPSNSS